MGFPRVLFNRVHTAFFSGQQQVRERHRTAKLEIRSEKYMQERKHLSSVSRTQEQGAKNHLLYPETPGSGQPQQYTGLCHRACPWLKGSSSNISSAKKVLAPAHCRVSSLWGRWEAAATLMLCLTKSLQFYNQDQNLDGKHFVKKQIPSHLDISRGENVWKGGIPLFKRTLCHGCFSRVFPALVQVLQLDKDP